MECILHIPFGIISCNFVVVYLGSKTQKILIGYVQYLLFLHRLKNFDDAPLIVGDIDTFKNFAVLPSSNLSDNLIIILISEQSRKTI